MRKIDMIQEIAKTSGLPKREVSNLVNLLFEEMKQSLERGEKVKITGFGTFILRHKRKRVGRNPKTGIEVDIDERDIVTFKPSLTLRRAMNDVREKENHEG